MTAFDFTPLGQNLPSQFKLVTADHERFCVRHRASNREYQMIKNGEEFQLYSKSMFIEPEHFELIYAHKELRPVLVALGIVKDYPR